MTTLSTFPATDLDAPETLKRFLGGFWSAVCEDQVEIDAFHDAVAAAWRQVARDAAALAASGSIAATPLRRVVEWARIVVESDAPSRAALTGLRYGPAARFGAAGRFGEPAAGGAFPVPLGPWITAAGLFDSQTRTRASWIRDADFHVDEANRVLWLARDPFRDPRLTVEPRFDDRGRRAGETIALWLWRAERDERWLWRRHGHVVGVDAPSTANGRELVAAVHDAVAAGSSLDAIGRILAAVFDAPLCAEDGEVVEFVGRDRRGGLVATDRRTYRHADAAAPVVAVGQVLRRGDPITDAVLLEPLRGGRVPPGAPGLVLAGEGGPLLAANAAVPLRFEPLVTS